MTTTRARPFSVTEYHQMAEMGILQPMERVELIEGQIIRMAAKNSPHSAVTKRVSDILRSLLQNTADIRIQEPVHLNDYSEPEPDIALVIIDERDYYDRHPIPSEVFLVVEVADSTLLFDLGTKAESYAQAGIPEYWVIDIKQQQVIVHRQSSIEGYQSKTVVMAGSQLALLAFPDIKLSSDRFFP